MAGADKARSNSSRALAFALALVFVLFFAEVAVHTHQNGQDDATCQVCQGAHVAPAPVAYVLVSSPLIAFEYVRPVITAFHQELFSEDCPSRAPPSLLS
jgi:hypothetical protein